MTSLHGFQEINIRKPVGKAVMTVTKTLVRFNKATVVAMECPEYVKILVNPDTRQIAVEPCSAEDRNAVKFSRAKKQDEEATKASSVTVREPSVVDAIAAGEISLMINTPLGVATRDDGYELRRAAVRHGITYATTLAAAQALIAGMQAARAGELDVAPLQEL